MLTAVSTAASTDSQKRAIRYLPIDREETYREWREMFDRDPLANPLQHPDYVLEELRRVAAKSRMESTVIRYGTDSECEGIAPLIPKTVRTDRVGGFYPAWSLNGLLLPAGAFLTVNSSGETQAQLLKAAVDFCASRGADFLLIEDLDEQSLLNTAIKAERKPGFDLFVARDPQSRWRIQLPDNEAAYWGSFSGKTRQSIRARTRKLGETHLECITDAAQVPAFLAAAHEISKHSWQTRQFGLRIRNDEAELRCMAVLAQHGFLRSYLLSKDGIPAAFAFCHQHAGCFRYEEVAYHSRFNDHSPGEALLQKMIEDLYQRNLPQVFDFGGGDAEYKRRFSNQQSRSQTVWLVPSTVRARVSLAYLRSCRAVRTTGREVVRLSGLATKARQWSRYGALSAIAKMNPFSNIPAAEKPLESDSGKGR